MNSEDRKIRAEGGPWAVMAPRGAPPIVVVVVVVGLSFFARPEGVRRTAIHENVWKLGHTARMYGTQRN